MQTERIRIRRQRGARSIEEDVDVPSEAERLRIARDLHAGRKFAVVQVLGWTVMYTPRWNYKSTSTPFDPLSGVATGEPTTTFGVSESCCTFGHLQDWTVCYTWKLDDEEPSITQVNPPATPDPAAFIEGARNRVDGDRIERSPGARLACLQHFGTTCYACGFDGARFYGPEAAGLIHVHHVNPLSSHAGEHVVDPVRDLRPLCPNCHYYVHLEDPPLSVETLRIRFQRAQETPVLGPGVAVEPGIAADWATTPR